MGKGHSNVMSQGRRGSTDGVKGVPRGLSAGNPNIFLPPTANRHILLSLPRRGHPA
ncbi:hypothetical protein [Yersinia sp. 2542 StPb PI]|uniref:hypothetical protein n=1 Tax=unclassified Yersinia (in: enterobacteria) TaxID=2653513 RepID=UPI003B284585